MKRLAWVVGAAALTVIIGVEPVGARVALPESEADIAAWNGIGIQKGCGGGNSAVPDHFLLLAWSEDLGAGHRIMAKRVRTNGLPVGGPDEGARELTGPTAPDGAKGEQRWPVLVPPIAGGGTALKDQPWPETADGYVVWSERVAGGADYDIYGQRISGSGFPTGRPRLLVGEPGDQVQPEVIGMDQHEMLLVWSDNTDDAGDIFGQRLTTALTLRGAPFAIVQGPSAAVEPALTSDGTNGVLVLWTDDRAGNLDIYGARLARNGLPRGGPLAGQFPVIESAENDYAPAAAVRGDTPRDQQALLLWTLEHATDGPDVMAQQLGLNGLPIGQPTLFVGGPDGQSSPAMTRRQSHEVTRDGDDGWMAIWLTTHPDVVSIEGSELTVNGRPPTRARLLQIVY